MTLRGRLCMPLFIGLLASCDGEPVGPSATGSGSDSGTGDTDDTAEDTAEGDRKHQRLSEYTRPPPTRPSSVACPLSSS